MVANNLEISQHHCCALQIAFLCCISKGLARLRNASNPPIGSPMVYSKVGVTCLLDRSQSWFTWLPCGCPSAQKLKKPLPIIRRSPKKSNWLCKKSAVRCNGMCIRKCVCINSSNGQVFSNDTFRKWHVRWL